MVIPRCKIKCEYDLEQLIKKYLKIEPPVFWRVVSFWGMFRAKNAVDIYSHFEFFM